MLRVKRFIRQEESDGKVYHIAEWINEENKTVERQFSEGERNLIEHINNRLKPKMTYDQLRDLVKVIQEYGGEKYQEGWEDGFESY